MVHEVKQILEILQQEDDDYMLVAGNTGKGAYPIFAYPRVLIDISRVLELKTYVLDQNLIVGASTTLTDIITLFYTIAKERAEFSYLSLVADHITLVAHIPVRNVGTIAGNLMVKHRVPVFSSDLFLLLETIGAVLTIIDKFGQIHYVTPAAFLSLDMTGKIITDIRIPPYSENYRFVSFKIMPRAQSAHAQVNAGFLYQLDHEVVRSARLVFGGISATFVHATKTEMFVVGKQIFKDEVLQEALRVLEQELVPEQIAGEMKPEFKKKCALGLFYKGLITIIPENRLNPLYRSGIRDLRRTRPLSKGSQEYDTNPLIWPITEPSPKVEALIQCAGEAKYVSDVPTQGREVFCAFVTSDVCTGEIVEIDPTPALKLPGVLAFFSAKDIPGKNNFLPPAVPTYMAVEEIFCSGQIKYYDQAIGVIVADSDRLANRAALLVQVKYKKDTKKPVLTVEDAIKDPNRVSLYFTLPPRGRGADVQRVIKDHNRIEWQYHFTMETLHTVASPGDDGLDVRCSSQWPDAIQVTVATALDIKQNRVNLVIPRAGGAYGLKISRSNHNAAACALVSYLMSRPCRFSMGIQAMLRIVGKRPPVSVDFEVGVNRRGEIQYLEIHLYEDNGYVFSDQTIMLVSSALKSCYENSRWSYKLFNVLTDTASNTWMRAPGTLEAIVNTEMIMEEISYTLNLDPVEVRRANLDPRYPEIAEMLDELLQEREYFKRKRAVQEFNARNRWKKRGIRVALMSWPASIIAGFQVDLHVLHSDGTVVVKHGAVEIGQGVNTKVIQVVAYTLNIPTDMVKIKYTDTDSNPNSFTTGGSRTTSSVCIGAIKCCQVLLDRLSAIRETMTDATWQEVVQAAFRAGINLQASYFTTSNDMVMYRVGGVAMAECELDVLTGEHEIIRVDIIEDVGTCVNPELDVGQIEGAFIMGVGYWTTEHIIYGDNGELLTDRTWFYHVPNAADIPLDYRVKLRKNSYNPLEILGSKAVAEPPTCLAICVAFAIREAIAASREDSGYPRTEWFHVDGPFTLEANVLSAGVKLEEFKYN